MTFNYTHNFEDPNSEAVEEVYYDENTRDLLVVLTSGHGYRYTNVPKSVFDEFDRAPSSGRYYATVVKRQHGPGVNVGWEPEVAKREAPATAAVGTPKNLTYAKDAKVFDLTSSSVEAPVGEKYRHEIKFTVTGADALAGVKRYTVEAGSVTEAVEALSKVGEALGLNFKVSTVTTYFD